MNDFIKCPINGCWQELEILGDDLVCPEHGAISQEDIADMEQP